MAPVLLIYYANLFEHRKLFFLTAHNIDMTKKHRFPLCENFYQQHIKVSPDNICCRYIAV